MAKICQQTTRGKILKSIPAQTLDVETQTGKLIRIDLKGIDFKKNTEYYVEISAVTKKDWGLLPKGFEVAHEQIKLDRLHVEQQAAVAQGAPLKVKETANGVIVSNSVVSLEFNKKQGRITSYIYKGNELIKDGNGPKPNFWRAVTDNKHGNK